MRLATRIRFKSGDCRKARPQFRNSSLEKLEDRTLLTNPPFSVGGDPIVNPADFRVTVFASGLNYPHGMTRLPDGSLLVGVSNPVQGSTSYFDSTGEILRFVDANSDGVADGPGEDLYDGLPGEITALHQAGEFILATSSLGGSERISVLREGATSDAPLTLAGSIDFSFPSPWEHTTYALAVRPTPGQAGSFDVVFNIGSQYNGVVIGSDGKVVLDANGNPTLQPTMGTVGASGLITGTLQGDSLYMVTLHDQAGTPVLSNLTHIATGLRNAASLAFDPTTGNLYIADNGIDGNNYGNEAWSADELDLIPAADIGKQVEDFGFPYSYVKTIDAPGDPVTVVNPNVGIQPIIAFEPLPDPVLTTEGSESEGASGFALSPPMFPAGLNHGVFIGFHGLFSEGGITNDENPMVFAVPSAGHYFDFISNDLPNIGHLDEALSSSDSLFVADISSTGDVFGANGPGQGVIYQIKAINHAPSLAPIAPQQAVEGKTLSLAISASDPDPGQTLRFSLGPNAPAGATIDPNSGTFAWAPTEEAPDVPVTVVVTDNGSPSLSDSETFQVDVSDAAINSAGTKNSLVATQGVATGNVLVGSFVDSGAADHSVSYSASIDWGDHTTSLGRVVVASKGDVFVRGSHRYLGIGSYVVTVTLVDDGGSKATATNTRINVAPPSGIRVLFADSFNTSDNPAGVGWSDINVQLAARQFGSSSPAKYREEPQTSKGGANDFATQVDAPQLRDTLLLVDSLAAGQSFTYASPSPNFKTAGSSSQQIHVEVDPLGPGSSPSTSHWAGLVFGTSLGATTASSGTGVMLDRLGDYQIWNRGKIVKSGQTGASGTRTGFHAIDIGVNLMTGRYTIEIDGRQLFQGQHGGSYLSNFVTLEDKSNSGSGRQNDYFDDLAVTAASSRRAQRRTAPGVLALSLVTNRLQPANRAPNHPITVGIEHVRGMPVFRGRLFRIPGLWRRSAATPHTSAPA